MKALIKTAVAAAAMTVALSANAIPVTGDIGTGGSFSGVVTSSNAWITSGAIDGEMVNFWTFTGNAGDTLSLFVTSSAIEFGVSLYEGIVDQSELLFAGFNNAGDFGDNVFVAGTNPVTGALGTSLLDILIPHYGTYTIAVGGEQGFSFDGLFAYDLQVDVTSVPEPATTALFALGLCGLLSVRRARRS